MNARSLKFQLIGWYALILTGCFALLAAATYLALQRSLIGALNQTQLRRSRQIAELVQETFQKQNEADLGAQVELSYAPAINDRFVRITRRDGTQLYRSPAPVSRSFDPATVPPPAWPTSAENVRPILVAERRTLALAAHVLVLRGVGGVLIEVGAPMDGVQADLKKWLVFLSAMFPAVLSVAVVGGFVLVKRALLPVDRITASAERISSQSLSERLPLANTGDELERLSLALNRMIGRLESAFQQSQRFVTDASHELRTPLTVMRVELEGLMRHPDLTPELNERIGSALEEVEHLAHIVEGLFAISRLDAGEAAAERVRLDLAKLVTATVEQMALLAEDKEIQVSCETSTAAWVEGDRARLKQVVVNLLDNAIKYTLPGGRIAIKVAREKNKSVLELTDTGIGIPKEALPRIFDRFYRVDPTSSRAQGGAGLGLSIVRSICAAHEGQVEARSTPGQGSCFRVELPFRPPPECKT